MPLFRLKCFPGLRSKTRSTKLHENRDPRNYTKWERLTRSYSFGYWFSLPWERGRLARIPREIDQIAGETPALPGQTEPVPSGFWLIFRASTVGHCLVSHLWQVLRPRGPPPVRPGRVKQPGPQYCVPANLE